MNRRQWIAAGLLSLVLALLTTAYDIRYARYDPDHHIFCSMLLKDNHPELFRNDYLFSDPRGYQFYLPGYRALARWFVGSAEGERMLERYNWMLFPAMFFYILGFYVLFYHLTSSPLAGWLTALAAISGRPGISVSAFGIGWAQSMYAYKLFLAGVPWVFYILMRFQFSRASVLAACLLLGCISNFHPFLGVGLATLLAVAYMARTERPLPFRRNCRVIAEGVVFFALGFLPTIHTFMITRTMASGVITAEEFWSAFLPEWGYLPVEWKPVRNFLMSAAPLMAFSAWVIRKRPQPWDRFMLIFAAASIVVMVLECLILQGYSRWTHLAPIISLEPLRNTIFIYIPLLAWTAVGLNEIQHKRWLLALSVLFIFAQKEFPFRHVFREGLLAAGMYTDERVAIWENHQHRWNDLLEVSSWARSNTDTDALFFHTHFDFRFHAQRGIIATSKDGSFMARLGWADELRKWRADWAVVQDAVKSKNSERMIEAARSFGCDYIVVRMGKDMPEFPYVPIFRNETYRIYSMANLQANSP